MSISDKKIIKELKSCSSSQTSILEKIVEDCGIRLQHLHCLRHEDAHNDFFYFALAKATKSLKSSKLLYDNNFFADGITILRSVYEAYLSIRYLKGIDKKSVIEDLLDYDAPIRVGNRVKENSIDYDVDEELYDFLCKHSHVNAYTSKYYIHNPYGFQEFTTSTNRIPELPYQLFLMIYLANLLVVEVLEWDDLDPPELNASVRQIIEAGDLITMYIEKINTNGERELYNQMQSRTQKSLNDTLEYLKEKSISKFDKDINKLLY